jgi:hypothetical protein
MKNYRIFLQKKFHHTNKQNINLKYYQTLNVQYER